MITLTVSTDYTSVAGILPRTAQLLNDTLRYWSAKATEYNPAFTSGKWDGQVCLYDRLRSRFPTGLLARVVALFIREGLKYDIVKALPDFPEPYEWTNFKAHEMRSYQRDAVDQVLKSRRGIIRIPTGGGKTLLALYLVKMTGTPRLVFFVPSRVLLNQTYKTFKAAFPDATVLKWGDGSKPAPITTDNYILITTVQSAWRRKTDPHLTQASMVVVDECHHQAATTFQEATSICNQARYLIGLSATPFRDDGAELEMEAWLGPLIYKIGYEELIKAGYLVEPEFHTVHTITDALRVTQGLKTLIFSEKINDLDLCKSFWLENNIPVLTGLNKSSEIAKVLLAQQDGSITHIAATPIFDEGLDIPNLEAVIFFAAGRSRVRALQRIGRIMRPSPGKTKCLVVDLVSHTYRDRVSAYISEPAFEARYSRKGINE